MAANITIKESFMDGGYYVADLTEDLMLINLNGMYPFYSNYADEPMTDTMLLWMQSVLEANPNK